MSAGLSAHGPHPAGAKFSAPGYPRDFIDRPRMHRVLDELFDTYSIVEIVAAPGAGKTVEAQLYASRGERRLAWLTLDDSDSSANGLLLDIATALGPFAVDAAGTMCKALHAMNTAQDAAAILASGIEDVELLLVIDDCQNITHSDSAAAALDTFLEYLPEHVRILLLAREELPWPLQKRYVHGQIAKLDDDSMALAEDEVEQYVALHGGDSATAPRIRELTGGWTAGVAFASRFGVGETADLRHLTTYFDTQVLDRLPAEEQWFLLRTCVCDTITREAAEALCGPDGQRLWSTVSGRHLPATSTTPTAITIHSLFRTFLRQRLTGTDPQCARAMRTAYASHLEATRNFARATDTWLSVGDVDAAMRTVTLSLPDVLRRADWAALIRRLDAFDKKRVLDDPVLVGAYVRAVYGDREFERARDLVRRLDREGRLRDAVAADPSLLATVAWALTPRPFEALAMLDKYDGDARADVLRYQLETSVASRAVAPPPFDDMPDVERPMSWGLFLQGRLRELGRFEPADAAAPLLNANVVLSAVFRGDADKARELWFRIPAEIRDRPQSRFVLAMLELFHGSCDTAEAELRRAHADCRRTGFSIGPAYEVFLACTQLVGAEDPGPALSYLETVLGAVSRSGHSAMVEIAQCFLGVGYLLGGRAREARLLLRDSVASMTRCERRLVLPMAAVALSDAEAVFGDPDAAHRAAEIALHTTQVTGANALMGLALRLFPAVGQRESEHETNGARWRRLVATPFVRPTVTPTRRQESTPTLRLRPFGRDRDLVLDGQPLGIGLAKILELAACLALHPGGINRFELQKALFPEADQRSGGNHFRQIAYKLRRVTDIVLRRDGALVLFPENVTVVADDVETERLLSEASSFEGPDRRDRLTTALDLAHGSYLEGSSLRWVEERRNYLDLVLEEGRLELATLHLELDEPETARTVCEQMLRFNRYSDPAYRVLVEVERKFGSESSALAVYRRAADAMGELGLEPGITRTIVRARNLRSRVTERAP